MKMLMKIVKGSLQSRRVVLSLLTASALVLPACGEQGTFGIASFNVSPEGEPGTTWRSNTAIAVGSRFTAEAVVPGGGAAKVSSSDPAVIQVLADGTLLARSAGTAEVQALGADGAVVDSLQLTTKTATNFRVVVPAALLQPEFVAPTTLLTAPNRALNLYAQLLADGVELYHAGLVEADVTTLNTKVSVGTTGRIHVIGLQNSTATIKLHVKDRPELRRTLGVAVLGNEHIANVTFHVTALGGLESKGREVVMVSIKARTKDGGRIHGVAAKWVSLAKHVEILGPTGKDRTPVVLVAGTAGKKGAVKIDVGDKGHVFVVDFPTAAAK